MQQQPIVKQSAVPKPLVLGLDTRSRKLSRFLTGLSWGIAASAACMIVAALALLLVPSPDKRGPHANEPSNPLQTIRGEEHRWLSEPGPLPLFAKRLPGSPQEEYKNPLYEFDPHEAPHGKGRLTGGKKYEESDDQGQTPRLPHHEPEEPKKPEFLPNARRLEPGNPEKSPGVEPTPEELREVEQIDRLFEAGDSSNALNRLQRLFRNRPHVRDWWTRRYR